MYVSQSQLQLKSQRLENSKKGSSLKMNTNEALINIHDLQQFVKSTFGGCMLPDLQEFLELEMQDKQCKIKLEKYKDSMFKTDDAQDYVYFLQSGKIFMKKKDSKQIEDNQASLKQQREKSAHKLSPNKMIRQQTSNRQKIIEVKQGSFFILANLRKTNDPEMLEIYNHQNGWFGCCLIGRIKFNKNYNIDWYIQQSQKHFFLSPLFQAANQYIHEQKVKGLSKNFKYQKFRRGTILATQGQQCEKLMILKSGECQYSKFVSVQEKNHTNTKTVKIANGEARAVIGQQFVLFDLCGTSKSSDTAVKALINFEKQHEKQNIKFKVYEKKANNFTITVLSAYAQVYWIEAIKFKQICQKYLPQVPQNMRKNIESNYVTLLRTTKQKLQLQFSKIKRNQNIIKEQRQTLQVKMKLDQINFENGHYDNNDPQYKNSSPIRLKPSELIQTSLRGEEVQKMRKKRLEKKIQLLLEANKNVGKVKNKIEIVLKDNVHAYATTPSPSHEKQAPSDNSSPQSPAKLNINPSLQQILMSSQGLMSRSNSLKRQTDIINFKQEILKKRYASQNNLLLISENDFNEHKNKLLRMDMIKKGIAYDKQKQENKFNMATLSNKMKKQCVEKINKANKIKEQYMTIRSQCQNCHCYDDYNGSHTSRTHKDVKAQTMMTGSAWRLSQSSNNNSNAEEPLEKLHSRTKLVSEKASRKYNHNIHLHLKSRAMFSISRRRMSAPLL